MIATVKNIIDVTRPKLELEILIKAYCSLAELASLAQLARKLCEKLARFAR